MKISDLLGLLGGLALFLYGMHMMSQGLEVAAGNKLKKILEALTKNRFLGVLAGAIITAIIQSSSATTVMVVGFVNSGLMTLRQAVWIIMGANIGTTITGQLIALDIGAIAPLMAFIGVALVVFFKQKKLNCIGEILAGLGILFIGMDFMSSAMAPLRESQGFIAMMTTFENPVLGILAGAAFTAVIQSSSASVGILQTLATSGLIGFNSAVFVLFGQNIGTCITAVLASIGTNKNAKRATLIHLLFNILGTLIFIPLCLMSPLTDWIASWTPENVSAQIANMHTLFNITTTIVLVPFGLHLAALAHKILPGKETEQEPKTLVYVQEHNIGSTAIAISQIYKETSRMLELARANINLALEYNETHDSNIKATIESNEECLDYLNAELTRYISRVGAIEMSKDDAKTLSSLFKVTGDIERIGDHALNIFEYLEMLHEHGLKLSKSELDELKQMQGILVESMELIINSNANNADFVLDAITKFEATMDELTDTFRQNQLDRLNAGQITPETCVIYSEILINLERVSDHLQNIAEDCSHAHLTLNTYEL